MKSLKEVSVIIPLYNAQTTICACLESLISQRQLPREIIVVDNGSTDTSVSTVRKFIQDAGCSIIRLAEERKRGPSAARNHGARIAQSEIIAFTDSDCFLPQDWVEGIIREFSVPGCPDIIAGGAEALEKESVINKFMYILRKKTSGLGKHVTYFNEHSFFNGPVFQSMNIAMPRKVFDVLGGFDEEYIYAAGEDSDFCERALKINAIIKFCPDVIVYHCERDSIKGLFKQFYTYELGAAKHFRKHYKGTWVFGFPHIGISIRHVGSGTICLCKPSFLIVALLPILWLGFTGYIWASLLLSISYLITGYIYAVRFQCSDEIKFSRWSDTFLLAFYITIKQSAHIMGRFTGSIKYGVIYF